jgi:adapter protein MecA 1/2
MSQKGANAMKIERVNEYTLKFFITYVDMEKRGFDREEIWYNRERGEELFWEIMDEAHNEEEFPMEGPLWIQVQALEKGLEILVTKAQLSKDGSKLELPINEEKQIDLPLDERFESMIGEASFNTHHKIKQSPQVSEDDELAFLIGFEDFEDVIQLSHDFDEENLSTSLYHFDDCYFLHVIFQDDSDEGHQDDQLSVLLEYGFETDLTIHRIEEYGKLILKDKALQTIRSHFPLKH